MKAAHGSKKEECERLLDLSPDLISRFDTAGRFSSVNRAMEKVVNMPGGSMLGKTPAEIGIHPETADLLDRTIKKVIATKQKDVIETKSRGKYFQTHLVPEIDERGSILSVMCYSRDITRLKNVEEALRESEGKYRTLVERSSDGIIIVQDGLLVYANPRMAELDGGTVEQLIGISYLDHVAPAERPRFMEMYRRRMAGENFPSSYESVILRRNGVLAPVELSAGLIFYHGKPADMVIIHDNSGHKQTEEELRRKEARFRTLALMPARLPLRKSRRSCAAMLTRSSILNWWTVL